MTWGIVSLGGISSITAAYVLGRIDSKLSFRPKWAVISDHGTFGLEPVKYFRSKSGAESHAEWLHRERGELTMVLSRAEWLKEMTERFEGEQYWTAIERTQRWIRHAADRLDKATPPTKSVEERLEGIEGEISHLTEAVTAEIRLHELLPKDPKTKAFPQPRPKGVVLTPTPHQGIYTLRQTPSKEG